MRKNYPVTNNEVTLHDNSYIVSKTDLKGVITYVNREFIEISGFSEKELLGAPQNIVRHPDMPPIVFEDMWNILKEDKNWSGVVKNRCKSGAYYWVDANVSPLFEQGRKVGYMSIRTKPTQEQIQKADLFYKKLRDTKATSLYTPFEKLKHMLRDMKIKTRFIIVTSLIAFLMVLLGYLGLSGMEQANQSMKTMYEDRLLASYYISEIEKGSLVAETALLYLEGAKKLSLAEQEIHTHFGTFNQALTRIDNNFKLYAATYLTPEEAKLFEQYKQNATKFHQLTTNITQSLQNNNLSEAQKVIYTELPPLTQQLSTTLGQLKLLQNNVGQEEYTKSVNAYSQKRFVFSTVMIVGLLVGIGLTLTFSNHITKRLRYATRNLHELMRGQIHSITIDSYDEVGQLLEIQKAFFTKSGCDFVEMKRNAERAMALKIALDNVYTGILLANEEGTIIYQNKAVDSLFRKYTNNIRTYNPNFDPDKVVGQNIDIFHKNPTVINQLLRQLAGTHRATIEMGGAHFNHHITPIFDESRGRLGTVLEMRDITQDVFTQTEMKSIVQAALQGDLTKRITLNEKTGAVKEICHDINNLLAAIEQIFYEVGETMHRVAQGDLRVQITSNYAGQFGELKQSINHTLSILINLIQQIGDATSLIDNAADEIATGNMDLSSRTEKQAASLEETASSVEELSATVKQNAENAHLANQVAQQTSTIALQGGDEIRSLIQTMSEINQSSQKIVEIIAIIDSISFQTNILALNAAVEAARAGEEGRGFSVVAAEVRNLAQRSAGAAKEIKALINESVLKVETGLNQVEKTGSTMSRTVHSIKDVSQLISEISTASSEQSDGIEQVSHAMVALDKATQQNAALVQESMASADMLRKQAVELNRAIQFFKTS